MGGNAKAPGCIGRNASASAGRHVDHAEFGHGLTGRGCLIGGDRQDVQLGECGDVHGRTVKLVARTALHIADGAIVLDRIDNIGGRAAQRINLDTEQLEDRFGGSSPCLSRAGRD